MTDPKLPAHIQALVDEYREPLGLDRWSIRLGVSTLDDARGCCTAQPEYREAVIEFDIDKLQTGDDLEEVVVHELVHCLTWPLHNVAEFLAPENARFEGEMIREAAERATTDVGQVALRYHRRLRNANAEIATLKKELREARKKTSGAERDD